MGMDKWRIQKDNTKDNSEMVKSMELEYSNSLTEFYMLGTTKMGSDRVMEQFIMLQKMKYSNSQFKTYLTEEP